MNEFTAKKAGEVFAFIRLVVDTREKSRDTLLAVMGLTSYDYAQGRAISLRQQLTDMIERFGMLDVMTTKSERTLAKITKARDEYIGDSWDDPIEVYEWLSFNAGAGSGHASETLGAAVAMQDEAFVRLNEDIMAFFDDLLVACKEYLHEAGKAKATTA